MNERSTGFYFVLFGDNEQVAYWHLTTKGWYVCGVAEPLYENELKVLDERRIERSEVSQ